MSVIRQKKIKVMKVTCISAVLLTILCIVLILYLLSLNHSYKKSITNNEIKEKNKTTVYQLIEDKYVNDIILKKDIRAVTLYEDSGTDILKVDDIVGKRCKLDLNIGTIIGKDVIYEGEVLEDDLRLHKYTCINLTEKTKVGDYVDIRISFPNGADFIVLTKKKVIDYSIYNSENNTDNSLWVEVSEEELLRMSSAIVDAYKNDGAYIYTIQYVEETQNCATSNYPVNDIVRKLIESDPNIINKAVNVLESKIRSELNLNNYKEHADQFNTNWRNIESKTELNTGGKSLNTKFENDDVQYNNPIEEEIMYID